MTTPRTRAAGLPLVAALTLGLVLLLAGCGAGGFGTKEPETLTKPITSYVALGDGFTAAPYVGTSSDKDGCLRSDENYPHQVAKALGVTSFKDVSCVGATTKAITDPFKPAGAKKKLKAQIDAIAKDTQLVTIGIGVENGNLLGDLFQVCSTAPCGTNPVLKTVKDALAALDNDLPDTIRAIVARVPQAYIVVVGYPELLPTDTHCKTVPKMDDSQFAVANLAWNRFSATVGSSARQAGAAYVDVRTLAANHYPCSDDPWLHSFRTVAGKQIGYHPVAEEQKVVAEAIAAQVRAR